MPSYRRAPSGPIRSVPRVPPERPDRTAGDGVSSVAPCAPELCLPHSLPAPWSSLAPWPASGGAEGAATQPPGTPTAHAFAGTPTVGPLFPPGSATHTCTASVVASSVGNLLITATHCIAGDAAGYTFAPGYHDGVEPYGSWTVAGAYAAPAVGQRAGHPGSTSPSWSSPPVAVDGLLRRDPVRHRRPTAWARRPPGGTRVTVPAYPAGPGRPTPHLYRPGLLPGQLPGLRLQPLRGRDQRLAVAATRSHRAGSVVGVIGGLHQGGCKPWTSYSAPFGPDTLRTYAAAARGTRTSSFPGPESDGCTTGL